LRPSAPNSSLHCAAHRDGERSDALGYRRCELVEEDGFACLATVFDAAIACICHPLKAAPRPEQHQREDLAGRHRGRGGG
jgi:hypothetical protein